jgi:hypothetical protein
MIYSANHQRSSNVANRKTRNLSQKQVKMSYGPSSHDDLVLISLVTKNPLTIRISYLFSNWPKSPPWYPYCFLPFAVGLGVFCYPAFLPDPIAFLAWPTSSILRLLNHVLGSHIGLLSPSATRAGTLIALSACIELHRSRCMRCWFAAWTCTRSLV